MNVVFVQLFVTERVFGIGYLRIVEYLWYLYIYIFFIHITFSSRKFSFNILDLNWNREAQRKFVSNIHLSNKKTKQKKKQNKDKKRKRKCAFPFSNFYVSKLKLAKKS